MIFIETYDYRTRASREMTAASLLSFAASQRQDAEARWNLVTDYYEGRHHTQAEIAESCRDAGIPWIAAVSPDPYLHVESQIAPDAPAFSFRPRDNVSDPGKALQREQVVRYITEAANLAALAPLHERRCILCGTAVWKVFWADTPHGEDVRIADIDPRSLYPDPAARRIEDCEYVNYVYRLHRRAVDRLYGPELEALGLDAATLSANSIIPDDDRASLDEADETLPVVEHWYRRGDRGIALSILVAGHEVRHVPDYWARTGCDLFPFVFQYRVAQGEELWGRSDLEPALPLVDAIDRELAIAQLQSAFTGSDVILSEYDAFSEPPELRPGALWHLKPGHIDRVKRLGGLGSNENRYASIDHLRDMIQDAIGNYDISMGREPSRTLSATGLATLIENANIRKAPKKAERMRAYAALYRLIDWTALEFYQPRRVIRLGAGQEVFLFDPDHLRDESGYFPGVDCVVSTEDPLQTSRAYTLSVAESLLSHQVTRENYPLFLRAVSVLDEHAAAELKEHFKSVFPNDTANLPVE